MQNKPTVQSYGITVCKSCSRCGVTFETAGRAYLCPACRQPKLRPDESPNKDLTFRERQIIELVYQAKYNKEIAYELCLAEGTIKQYLNNLFRKLGVKNRTGVALWGARQAQSFQVDKRGCSGTLPSC